MDRNATDLRNSLPAPIRAASMRDARDHDGLLPGIVREEDAPVSDPKPPVAATRPLEPLDVAAAGQGVSLDLLDHPAPRWRVEPLQVTKCPRGVRDAPFAQRPSSLLTSSALCTRPARTSSHASCKPRSHSSLSSWSTSGTP